MKVVDVLPLSKGIFRESLSYFTNDENVTLGSVVSVPVRGRSISALVSSIRDARDLKTDLKKSSFSLRKIEKLKSAPFLLPEFMQAAEDTARFSSGGVGAVLGAFLPKAILESRRLLRMKAPRAPYKKKSGKPVREVSVLQASDEERFSEYKSLIRERFARGLSVYLCFSTTQEANELLSSLDRGITQYSFLLHAGLSKKEIGETWEKALEEPHPILIIGTGTFLSIPREDIGMIIIERESSRFYKSNNRPYADVRVFAEYLSRRRGIELLFGDLSLRIETIYKTESGEYAPFGGSLKFKALGSAAYRIADMRAPASRKEGEKQKFEILGSDVKTIIAGLKERGERLFIFTARRGLSPLTLCGDCGTVVNCTRCSAPVTLHRGGSFTYFLCHHCGEKRDARERCRVCESWKLETLGIGIEGVEQAIRKMFPDVPLYRLDRDTAKTNKQALAIALKFSESPGSILLGTELATYYFSGHVENAAIISIDSLFSLPDFRIDERVFSLILSIRARTLSRLVIQTRNIEASVLAHAATGAIGDFYREEIEIRKKFDYPPFSVLIKISIEGKKEAVERAASNLESALEGYSVSVFPAFISTVKGKYIMNALVSLPRKEWPDDALIAKLKALPPSYKVQVDPENML